MDTRATYNRQLRPKRRWLAEQKLPAAWRKIVPWPIEKDAPDHVADKELKHILYFIARAHKHRSAHAHKHRNARSHMVVCMSGVAVIVARIMARGGGGGSKANTSARARETFCAANPAAIKLYDLGIEVMRRNSEVDRPVSIPLFDLADRLQPLVVDSHAP